MHRLARASGAPTATWLLLPIVAAVGVLSALSPALAVVAALGVIVMALTVVRLVWGVALLTFLTFLEGVPGLDGVVIAKPLGLVLVLSWALALLADRERPFLPHDHPVFTGLLVAFVALGCLSAAWALEPGAAMSSSLRLATVVSLVFVVYTAVETPRDLRLVVAAFVGGAFTVTVVAFASGETVAGRLSAGGAFDPNYLAAVLATAIALTAFMLPGSSSLERAALLAVLGTCAVALVLTGSRGGLVATAALLLVGIAAAGRYRAHAIVVALGVVMAGLVVYFIALPPELRERTTNISTTSTSGRSDEWQIALHMASDNPIVGVGMGNYPTAQLDYVTAQISLQRVDYVRNDQLIAHSTYLEVLAELGAVGLALLLGILLYAFAQGWRGARIAARRSARASSLMRGVVVGTVGLLTAYVFLSGQYQKRLWLLVGLLVALPHVARRLGAPGAETRPR